MIIELKNVDLTYQSPDGEVEALKDISFGIEEGEFVSIVGPSGCGKSTLLSLIAGLEKHCGGKVTVDGEEITGTTEKIGFMPQRDHLFEWLTIWNNVTLGLKIRHINDDAHKAHVRELLENTDLLISQTNGPLSFRAVCASAARLYERSRQTRRYCCLTSRFRRLTTRQGLRYPPIYTRSYAVRKRPRFLSPTIYPKR